MVFSQNAHLGDALFTANWLRRVPGNHTFHVPCEWVDAIAELMSDRPNITIDSIKNRPLESLDTWVAGSAALAKNVQWNHNKDIMGFLMEFHNAIGDIHGLGGGYTRREDMLWDSAVIGPPKMKRKTIDFLIINAGPQSGQCPDYDKIEMAEMVTIPLHRRWNCVSVCGNDGIPSGYTLAEIGAFATMAKHIIMVATGPGWVCWNEWSKDAEKVVLLEKQYLDFGKQDAPVHHCTSAKQVRDLCIEKGWL